MDAQIGQGRQRNVVTISRSDSRRNVKLLSSGLGAGASYLLPAVFKTLILPPMITYVCLRTLQPTAHYTSYIPLSIVSILTAYILRTQISVYQTDRAARRAGAAPIPRVKGKYPLNVDILFDWARSGSEEEVGRMMVLLGRRYGGTYNTRVLGEDQVITTDPRVVRHAFIDDFENFIKGHKTRTRAQEFLGDGIFNADGDRWRFHRSLTRPFFHPSHVSPDLFSPHIRSALASLPTPTTDRFGAFDIQKVMGDLALHMAIDWLCGIKLDEVHDRGEEWERARRGVGDAMRQAQAAVGRRVKIGTTWPLFELRRDPLAEPMRVIRAFFRPLIHEALQRKERFSTSETEDPDKKRLIDRLVEATDDLKLIEDQLINILLASRDTTASLLTFCMYAIALHPEILNKVQSEILAVAGPDGPITKETIRDSRRFINETLRLFPPFPLNIRRSINPSLLPTSNSNQKMYMPANTALVVCTILMQRDKNVWGEDADEFKPEGWEVKEDEEGSEGFMKGREGFAAWNLGPRMCLGQPFALTVAHTFLIHLMRHMASLAEMSSGSALRGVRIELATDAQPEGTRIPRSWSAEGGQGGDGRARDGRDKVWIVSDVVLAVKGGLWVRFVT